jgi:hypothetical protein
MKDCVPNLHGEQFVKIFSPFVSDLILLHQEMICFILNALNLVEVPCLPIADPSHLIYVLPSFLRAQTSVKFLVCPTLCHTAHFAVFLATLYFTMLSILHSFFLIVASLDKNLEKFGGGQDRGETTLPVLCYEETETWSRPRKSPNPGPPSLAGRHRPLCNDLAGGWRAGCNPRAGGA